MPLRIYFFIGFLINVLAFYPGYVSPDGIDQYTQALTGRYGDWHPPAMAFVWSLLNKLHKTSGLMMTMQLAWFWYACYVLASSIKQRVWRVLIIVFSLAPFVHNFSAYVVKDTQMAFAWLLAFALMFRAWVTGTKLAKGTLIAIFLLLLYGIWARPNAFPGGIPLCFLFAGLLLKDRSFKRVSVLTVIIVALILTGGHFFNRALPLIKQYPETKSYLHDLSGIYLQTGENVFPAFLYQHPAFDTAHIRRQYTTATFDGVWWNSNGQEIVGEKNDEVSAKIRRSWMGAIAAHPTVYLKNRYDGFLSYLRIKPRIPVADYTYRYKWMQPNTLGLTNEGNAVASAIFTYVEAGENMPYMRPWFWALLNVILFGLIPLVKDSALKQGYVVLLLSSFLYFIPQFFIYQTDTDFRYSYWNCIACTVSLFILITSRRPSIDNGRLNKNAAP